MSAHDPPDDLQDDVVTINGGGELARLKAWRAELLKLAAEQAEDEALWARAEYISEAYIQQELRRLTALVEREP